MRSPGPPTLFSLDPFHQTRRSGSLSAGTMGTTPSSPTRWGEAQPWRAELTNVALVSSNRVSSNSAKHKKMCFPHAPSPPPSFGLPFLAFCWDIVNHQSTWLSFAAQIGQDGADGGISELSARGDQSAAVPCIVRVSLSVH
eukprot:1759431-Pleurochrysis_carterae.AAC.1